MIPARCYIENMRDAWLYFSSVASVAVNTIRESFQLTIYKNATLFTAAQRAKRASSNIVKIYCAFQ